MKIKDIDQLTIFTKKENLNPLMRFYHEVFDLPVIKGEDSCLELQLGQQKLRFVTELDTAITPQVTESGSAFFCVIAKDSLDYVTNHLANYGVDIVQGPLKTKGANGEMHAIFVNDPDGNVIEICEYAR